MNEIDVNVITDVTFWKMHDSLDEAENYPLLQMRLERRMTGNYFFLDWLEDNERD